jgi:hypothetical protein
MHPTDTMTTFVSIIAPENTLSTSCLSSILRLQHSRTTAPIMIDISPTLHQAFYKAKQLDSIKRIVCIHGTCGVSSDFILKEHPYPIVTTGYGVSSIDWERMRQNLPCDSVETCKEAGVIYNFDITKASPVDSAYMMIDTCEAKLLSFSPDVIETIETEMDHETYELKTRAHVYVDADTLHNVEFCFVGSFIEKYGKKEDT